MCFVLIMPFCVRVILVFAVALSFMLPVIHAPPAGTQKGLNYMPPAWGGFPGLTIGERDFLELRMKLSEQSVGF